MRTWIGAIAIIGWLGVAQAALADLPLPEGTWDFNGDGYEGQLVLKVGDGGKVTGTVYGSPIVGWYDLKTRQLNFVRMGDPHDPAFQANPAFQSHKGYLFANESGKNTRYTLAGTFIASDPGGSGTGVPEMGWYAQIVTGDPPVTGDNAPGVELLDAVMLKYLKKIGGTGATLTVARGNQTLYSRGYGWSDRERKTPIPPDTPMVTASCDKPLTAAMVRQLARDGKLDLNASIFKVMKTKPVGAVVDPRVWDITIKDVLDHKAGWQGEPVTKAWQAYNGAKWPIESFEALLGHVMVQTLSFKPGEKEEYDNFGYNMLKTVVTQVSGHSYTDYLRHELCRPHGIKELKWVRHGARREGEPPRLWNGLILEDPKEYRMGVSTPALCAFMHYFWIDGQPRHGGNPTWIKTGGTGGSGPTTSMMYWRSDGINIAWVFNNASDEYDNILKELDEQAINPLIQENRLPPPPSR